MQIIQSHAESKLTTVVTTGVAGVAFLNDWLMVH